LDGRRQLTERHDSKACSSHGKPSESVESASWRLKRILRVLRLEKSVQEPRAERYSLQDLIVYVKYHKTGPIEAVKTYESES